MRTSTRLLANATSGTVPMSAVQASAQLLPPIPLYRRLLRAHRHLPPDMRFMGDAYVKSEFRLTRSTDNAIHIIGFLGQWKMYLDELERAHAEAAADAGAGAARAAWLGRKLDVEAFERMSNEQVGQLYELMHATKELWKTPEENEEAVLDAEAKEEGANKQ